MKTWEEIALEVEEVYGGYVDWDERFFECPECGEPIYECDWSILDFARRICPVCDFSGKEEGEEE